jgi:hypothetical protein
MRLGPTVRFARLIDRRGRAFWRTYGPRRLRRQSMSVQAASPMAAIAAATVLVCRTVIENRMWWRRQAASTLADQNPESARKVRGPAAPTRRIRPAVSLTTAMCCQAARRISTPGWL